MTGDGWLLVTVIVMGAVVYELGRWRGRQRRVPTHTCPLCVLPVPVPAWEGHLEWHRALILAAGDPRAAATNPPRPPQPRRPENGGPR